MWYGSMGLRMGFKQNPLSLCGSCSLFTLHNRLWESRHKNSSIGLDTVLQILWRDFTTVYLSFSRISTDLFLLTKD